MKWDKHNAASNPYKYRHTLLAVLVVGLLLGVGTAFYSVVEGWSFLNSLYFSIITISTVGFGDLAPTTPISKLFTILYVIGGVAAFGTFLRWIVKRTDQTMRSVVISAELVTNTPRLAQKLDLPIDQGVLVLGIDKQGKAYDAGLRIDDVIVRINNKKVYGANDVLEKIIKSSCIQAPVITVQRGDKIHKIELGT